MRRTAILLATLLCIFQVAWAERAPSLEISPNMKIKDTAIDSNAVLFCQPNVEDVTLLEGLRWMDINGQEIQNDARKYTEKAPVTENPSIDGLNLIIKSFKKDDSGTYTCTAEYNKEKLNASIEVIPYLAITFKDAPPRQHPIAGKPGYITCVVEAQPEPEIHWYKDGHQFNLDEGGRCSFDKQRGIRCSSFSKEDDGNYSCQARVRRFGNAEERTIIVDVHTKPIIHHPADQHRAKEDESLQLKCVAEGNPKPTYSWLDVDMQSYKGRLGYEVDENEGTLEINKIAREDAGHIRCVAENAAGNDTRDFLVEVIVKPKIKKFENQTIAEGEIASLECHVDAEPTPRITFVNVGTQERYNNDEDSSDDSITVIPLPADGSEFNVRVYVLKFDEVKRRHDGLYRCIAENDGGRAEATGHLEVQYSPMILNATNVQLSWINNPVNISCIFSAIPNATITWEFNDRPLDSNVTVSGSGWSSTIMVFPNSKASFGNYSCQAKNIIGSHKHTISLLEATVPDPLQQTGPQLITATTITFSLGGPRFDGGLPVTEYVVKYKLSDKSWDDPTVKERRWRIGSPYIIEKLQPEVSYDFTLAAINQVGTGNFSKETHITMKRKAAPEEPKIVVEDVSVQLSTKSDRYQLNWKIPNDNGEAIDYFTVTYFSVRNSTTQEKKFERVGNMVEKRVTNAMSTSYTIEGLIPNTYYKVELRAHNVIGFSTPSTINIKTAKDPASLSIDPFQTEINDSSGESALSMAGLPLEVIIGVAVAILLLVIVIIDVGCYVTSKTGILMFFCVHVCKKHPPNDKVKEAAALEEGKAKDSKDILTTGASNPHVPHDEDEAKDATEETPMIDGSKKEKEQEANRNAVENDVNVAKDSAV